MKTRKSYCILLLLLILILPSLTCTNLDLKNKPTHIPESAATSEDESVPDPAKSTLPIAIGDEIQIYKTSAYEDVFGFWNIHGLLKNSANYTVGSAEIEVILLDSNGNSIHTEIFYSAPYGVAPGETQPFGISLPAGVSILENFDIHIRQLRRVETNTSDLEISKERLSISENGIATLRGEVQNIGDLPAEILTINAALFSAEDDLITTATCQVCPGYLAPGDSSPFQFMVFGYPPESVIDHFEIYFSSESAATRENYEIAYSELIHTYTDSADNFHILGEIQNNSGQILDLRFLTTLFDKDQQIIGASSDDLPLSALVPGESSPFHISFTGPADPVDWSIQVDLAGSRVVDTPSYVLSTTGDSENFTEYMSTFSGQVVNDTGETLQIVLVVIGLREKSTGRLIGLSSSLLTGEFLPGSSIDYNLTISPDPEINPGDFEKFIISRGR